MNSFYSIGIDFGTDSGRVVIVDVKTGCVIAEDATPYTHKVMTAALPHNNLALPNEFALQHPQDYLEVLERSIPTSLEKAGINSNQIIGIGVDFTSSTMIPTDEHFTPLCFKDEWKDEPHAYAKLWKHHGSIRETNILNALAVGTQQEFLCYYGGSISCEWMIPKCVELAEKAPQCYEAATYLMEAGDWVVAQLTGKLTRSHCAAGFKSFYDPHKGYPTDFFEKISPLIATIEQTKLQGDIKEVGTRAGVLTKKYAELLNLTEDTPVATAIIDAHSAVIGMGASEADTMVMVMGTSTCHITLSERKQAVQGISGVVENGIIPSLYAYEAGQSAVGDIFSWFRKHQVPSYIEEAASRNHQSVFWHLEELASSIGPGETGLLALDWHNGNRSVLNNPNLSGLILGQTLQTTPQEVFLALMESTAYGARTIMEAYRDGGIEIKSIYACGGLPAQNKRLVQIYADVTKTPISVASTHHVSAVGAAILGAVAAGSKNNGYDSLQLAMQHMNQLDEVTYEPIQENVEKYEKLYQEYKTLMNYFGQGANAVMARLKEQRNVQSASPVNA